MNFSNTDEYYKGLQEAAEFVKKNLGTAPVAIVLGSGLNNFTSELANAKELPYSQIPHMPKTTVSGHLGKMVLGEVAEGKRVVCLAGRSHGYEGYQMFELTFMARLLSMIGCKILIATNAAGGSQKGMYPGCLMIINDHINFYKRNPLADTVEHDGLAERHPDLTNLYSTRIADLAKQVGSKMGIQLFEGIYGATSGPAYETPSEVISFSKLGASAFGMSTIPETMTAKAIGMEVFALSLITNLAAGMSTEILTHGAVTDVAQSSAPSFIIFMRNLLREISTVEVEMIKPSSNPLITPLPSPVAGPASSQQIQEAVTFLKNALKGESKVAIFLSEGHDKYLNTLSNSTEVLYSSIPHFPSVGPSRKGKLVIGTTKNNQTVYCLAGHAREGLACEEATFLAEVLAQAGVAVLLNTFVTGTSNPQKLKVGQVAYLRDCLDSTTIHSVPSGSLFQYDVRTEPLSHKYGDVLRSFDNSVVDAVYIFYPGPSFPTPAEVSVASQLSCDAVGMTSTALIYAARASGMEVASIAEVVYDLPKNYQPTSDKVTTLVNHLLTTVQTPSTSSTRKGTTRSRQVDYTLARPVIQGEFEKVIQAVNFVHQQTNNASADYGIVVDSALTSTLFSDKLKVVNEIPFSSIPNYPSGNGKIVFGHLNGSPVFVIFGTLYVNEGATMADITFGIRVFDGLKVKKALFVSPMCSVTSEVKLGELAVIRDHVALSGRSSLFGHNEERWGTRFPDVSEAYSREITSKFIEGATHLNIKSNSIVFSHFIGPMFGSFADANYAHYIETQAICTGVAPEVVAARHSKILVGALGIINSRITKEKGIEEASIESGLLRNVEELLARVVAN